MADKKKKKSATEKYAEKAKKKKTTSDDVPGKGAARNAAKAMENYHKRMKDI